MINLEQTQGLAGRTVALGRTVSILVLEGASSLLLGGRCCFDASCWDGAIPALGWEGQGRL